MRHLGLGRDASCALHALSRAERTRRAPQEHLGFRKLAELSHGDPRAGRAQARRAEARST